MYLPAALALVLCLLGGTLAHAQSTPTREPRRRSVAVTGSPVEVRIATGTRTVFVFAVPIRGEAVEVDRARIQVVDTGGRSLIIEALGEPRAGERWALRVPLADGRAPELAEFALVSHPFEVDTELEVARREPSEPACPPASAPCAPMRAADAFLAGLIDSRGVQPMKALPSIEATHGFDAEETVSYRAGTWVMVDVTVILPPSHAAWRPTVATLKSKTGEARVRTVTAEPSKKHPGWVRVLVEADEPPPSAGLKFTLHLYDVAGEAPVSLSGVTLSPAQEATK